jgi:hypothetical protein
MMGTPSKRKYPTPLGPFVQVLLNCELLWVNTHKQFTMQMVVVAIAKAT